MLVATRGIGEDGGCCPGECSQDVCKHEHSGTGSGLNGEDGARRRRDGSLRWPLQVSRAFSM